MNKDPHRTGINSISKWLFALTLILAIFSYADLSSSIQNKPQVYQTTLQARPETGISKSIGYKRALHCSHSNSLPVFDTHSVFNLISLHTALLKTQLVKHSTPNIPVTRACLFCINKIIAPSKDDTPAILS